METYISQDKINLTKCLLSFLQLVTIKIEINNEFLYRGGMCKVGLEVLT